MVLNVLKMDAKVALHINVYGTNKSYFYIPVVYEI